MSDKWHQKGSNKDQQAFDTLRVLIFIGLVSVFFYSICPTSTSAWYRNLSIGVLVSGASLAFGGFFGFLFGMPRAMTRTNPSNNQAAGQGENKNRQNSEENKPNVEPNTNLEQISDWLTKILVGAGLTQLNKIPEKLGQLSNYISDGMNGRPADKAFVVAAIIFFGVCGFLAVFLWTRLYMAKLLEPQELLDLAETDRRQQEQIEQAGEILKRLAQSGAERAMEDPLLSEHQAPGGEAQVQIAAELVQSTDESRRSATDLMILAFYEFQAQNYRAAAENAEKALRASPQKEMLWKIYNLLGLCYHWQEPPNWKPGDDLTWFNNAKKHYEAACKNNNSLSEDLLSKANLCYVYLDAQKYSECEDLAQAVIQNESIGGVQIASLCDLARIASAAAKVLRGDKAGAAELLNGTRNLSAFEYLFNPEDLPDEVIRQFPNLPNLKPDVVIFLKRMAGF